MSDPHIPEPPQSRRTWRVGDDSDTTTLTVTLPTLLLHQLFAHVDRSLAPHGLRSVLIATNGRPHLRPVAVSAAGRRVNRGWTVLTVAAVAWLAHRIRAAWTALHNDPPDLDDERKPGPYMDERALAAIEAEMNDPDAWGEPEEPHR